jgi:hypothetical protein
MYACNVILFRKASRVRTLDEETELSTSSGYDFLEPDETQGGPEVEYTVWLPPKTALANEVEDDASLSFESLEGHYVSAVRVETQQVKTFRFSKEEPKSEG